MNRFILFVAACLVVAPLRAQKLDPVHWTLTSEVAKAPPGSTVPLRLIAKLDEGWHLYSLTTPQGGPIPTTAGLAESPMVASTRFYEPKPARKFDPNFNLDTETYEQEAVFLIAANLKNDAPSGSAELTAQVRYQSCNDKLCLPPKKKTAAFTLSVDPSAPALPAFIVPVGYQQVKPGDESVSASSAAPITAGTTAPTGNLPTFLLTAFGLGLAAIFTPCCFPMIPITVSFFLNRRGGIAQALLFSFGIIVFFCLLGLGVTAIVGPFGINQLGSSIWVNGFIALVFGVFALSLLGAFEIALPSSMLTKLDQASRRGGQLGTLVMGLTFSLTSFACVGPFMGSLLVASVQSKGVTPVLGMMSFAIGLAAPFFLLAAFPSYLKKLPKSGGWLVRVKVVMGFALLAFMLKYASNIDQVLQTNWLTRDRFLAAWFVLAIMAGMYLLGLLRLEGVEPGERLGIGRLLIASIFLIFGFTLLPGMFGAPLGDLDAFVPAATGQTFSGIAAAGISQAILKNQYPQALEQARQEHKLVLITFTGYACTNCHWMKANMFPRPEIAAALKNFVVVELYTDGTDAASEANQKLEDEKFSTNAEPYYAIVDPDQKVIAKFEGMTTKTGEFLAFLKTQSTAG